MEENAELQSSEFEVLAAMYSADILELCYAANDTNRRLNSGRFEAFPMIDSCGVRCISAHDMEAFVVQHLPPFCLRFVLPTGYPSTVPPRFFFDL